LTPASTEGFAADPSLRQQILDVTDGVGVDVAMEMAGHPSSVNNALSIVRRGGHVVLFGLKNGDTTIQDFHRVIMNGQTLHGVVGRRLFGTWEVTRSLLENTQNGIQDAVWKVILAEGRETIVDASTFDRASFEDVMARYTKPVLRWS
jgi:threonine 3-dehydrogenase